MANPNVISVSSLYGKTVGATITTTDASKLANQSNSGKILKVNTIFISNVDGTDTADVTASVKIGSDYWNIAKTIAVPADTTLVLVSKDTAFYLEEAQDLYLQASSDNKLEALISYEEIS